MMEFSIGDFASFTYISPNRGLHIFEGIIEHIIPKYTLPQGIAKELLIQDKYPAYDRLITYDRLIMRNNNGSLTIIPVNLYSLRLLNYIRKDD